jgi:hypothetical protein
VITIRGLFLAFAITGLAACTQQASVTPAAITTAVPLPSPSENVVMAKSVAAASQSFTLAMQTAKIYTDLPRCRTPRVERLCSDTETVREIRRAAIKAHNALMDARKNTVLIDTALRAIDLFRAVIPQS